MSKKQIHKLYLLTAVGYFLPAGSSWVALLALRGFSVLEIGLLESIFHIVSFCFELPSGVVADVFGRKRGGRYNKVTLKKVSKIKCFRSFSQHRNEALPP